MTSSFSRRSGGKSEAEEMRGKLANDTGFAMDGVLVAVSGRGAAEEIICPADAKLCSAGVIVAATEEQEELEEETMGCRSALIRDALDCKGTPSTEEAPLPVVLPPAALAVPEVDRWPALPPPDTALYIPVIFMLYLRRTKSIP